MLLPERLYSLTSRDVGQEWARFFTRFGSAAGLVVAPTGDAPTPPDEILVITQLTLENVPGAGNTYLRSEVGFRPVGAAAALAHRFAIHHAEVGLAAGVRASLNLLSPIWLPPGQLISFTGNFTGAATSNTVNLHITGFSLPLGTLLRA